MLELKVHDGEHEVVLRFEHSLLAISKWESRTKKPFLTASQKTHSELIDYFGDMLLSPEVERTMVYRLNPEQLDQLANYINDPMTASSVHEQKGRGTGEQVTSELIYYWMVALQIPFVAETWHLNRLMMLITITNIKQNPDKKTRRRPGEIMKDWRAINEERRKRFGTSG